MAGNMFAPLSQHFTPQLRGLLGYSEPGGFLLCWTRTVRHPWKHQKDMLKQTSCFGSHGKAKWEALQCVFQDAPRVHFICSTSGGFHVPLTISGFPQYARM